MKNVRSLMLAAVIALSSGAISNSLSQSVYAQSTKYTLKVDATKIYMSSNDAKAKKNAVPGKIYKAGTYFIFNQYNGMINITKQDGTAGGWINPTEIVSGTTPETKPLPVPTGSYVLSAKTQIFNTADDAMKNVKPTGSYPSGTYYIYKTYGGAINITKIKGRPGGWIKNVGSSTTIPEPTATTTKPEVKADIVLTQAVPVYMNADDAKASKKSIKTYPAGNYFIYKKANGMINISKVKGVAGAWYNPNENVKPVETTTTTVEPTTTTKSGTIVEFNEEEKKLAIELRSVVYEVLPLVGPNMERELNILADALFYTKPGVTAEQIKEQIAIVKALGEKLEKASETTSTTVESTTTTV